MKRSFYVGVLVLSACMPLCAAEQNLPQIPKIEAWRKNLSSGKEQTLKPALTNESIRFGSKTLVLDPNGDVKYITDDNGNIGTISMSFHAVINGKNIYNWRAKNFDSAKSTFIRKGNLCNWDLFYKLPDGKSISLVKQSLEVLADGRIRFTGKYTFPTPTDALKFVPHRLQCFLPEKFWLQETVLSNGTIKNVLVRNMKPCPAGGRIPLSCFGVNTPAKKFSIQLNILEAAYIQTSYRPIDKGFYVHIYSKKETPNTFIACFDFTKGLDSKNKGVNRGGVIFEKQENMSLPDVHEKNMVMNPSFECGFEGWVGRNNANYQWGWVAFTIDSKTAYEGKNSLRFEAREGNVWNNPTLGPFQFVLNPGTYTFSFYAKGETNKKTTLYLYGVNFHHVEKGGMYRGFKMTPEWKRYSVTFSINSKNPVLPMQFCAIVPKGSAPAKVWLDAVQLEKGNNPTAFQPHAVEGYFLSAKEDNFFSEKEKIDGRLRIITAKPNDAGKVRITVKNFFSEILLDQTKDFKTDGSRTAELKLPLDNLPGLGVFLVKCEYKLNSGATYYDFHRYARIEYQDMPRPNKQMFSPDYGYPARGYNYVQILERWKNLGCGSQFHHPVSLDKRLFDLEIKHGATPYFGSLLRYIRNGGKAIKHFCIIDSPYRIWDQTLDDPKILIRDYHLDSNGTVTPEYQAKLKKAVITFVKKYPHVKIWCFGGELTCKFPNEWWGKGFTDRDVAHTLALMLKPFVEGVKEANPKALVFQDCPANMSPTRGIAETDLLLDECNKLGVRFDVICIHPYRASPENPDLDADAKTFFAMLKKRGYDKTTVIWPEGMHWGPFEIPQWGTIPNAVEATPRKWEGVISYDMSWTEKKSAAWYARSWLVSLKYQDRVLGFTAGNGLNNSFLDCRLTPYAAQLMPNTMSCLLGDARFKKDIRLIPYLRTFIFEDAKKRPVAVVWNHHEDVDSARVEAPWITVDFGNNLESVRDLMNSPRKVVPGKMRFQASTFPLFFIGKPGTLNQMISAFEKIDLDADSNFKPITVNALPANETQMKLTVKNILSRDFKGTLNGKPVTVPSSGSKIVMAPLPSKLNDYTIHAEKMNVTLKSSDAKNTYSYDFEFNAFKVKHIADTATIDTAPWGKMPAVRFPKYEGQKTSGEFRIGWNKLGLYLEVKVKDPKFVHVEYTRANNRWNNDCLQIFLDTYANARERTTKGFDDDDYSYAVFPNSKGNAARMFRFQSVESQLGLATQAPPDNTFADDIPCRFSNRNGVLTYRTFIPAKYLLPIKLQKNYAFGIGLYASNSDQPGKQNGKALSLASDGDGCYNRPHTWPVAILAE